MTTQSDTQVVEDISSRTPNHFSDKNCQRMLAVLFFLVVGFWSFGIPFNGAPDESTHFFLLEYIHTYHTLPSITEPAQKFTGGISHHTWQPGEFWYHGLPFPHVIGALLTSNVLHVFIPESLQYLGARSINWIFGAIFICALFRTSRTIGLTKSSSATVAALTSLIPQVTFVFAYFNSDGYGIMCVALTVSSLLAYLKHPIRKRAVNLGVSIGLLLLAKLYFFPALVFVAMTLLAHYSLKNRSWSKHTVSIILTAIVFSLPMLVLTYANYGEISGFSGQSSFVDAHRLNPAAGFGTCYVGCTEHFINLTTLTPWITLTLKSYFSVTGWMNVFLPAIYYQTAAYLFVGLITLSLYQVIANRRQLANKSFLLYYITPLILIFGLYPSIAMVSLLASQKGLPQPQGRYLFVTIPFLSMLISITAIQILSNPTNDISIRENRAKLATTNFFLAAVLLWMTWTNLASWTTNISATDFQNTPMGSFIKNISTRTKEGNFARIQKDELLARIEVNQGLATLRLPFSDEQITGNIDSVKENKQGISISGWTYTSTNQGRANYVVIFENKSIKAISEVSHFRPDVSEALNAPEALYSGYKLHLFTIPDKKSCTLKLYTLTSNFKFFAMPDICEKLNKLPQ